MATIGKNLSSYNKDKVPSAEWMKIAIVVSEWNEHITSQLLKGAKDSLLDNECLEENILTEYVPGTFELPVGAQFILESKEVDAVICIGSVIQGETKHFDFVCSGAAQGIKDVAIKHSKPVIFCVLTDNIEQQALDRSGGKHGNKGTEAGIAAIKMVDLKKRLSSRNTSLGF
mgnify:CR=1 FL=1